MKTHVRGFFDTDLHDVNWHFASVTYFDLIGSIGACIREFQHSKYKFSSHPKTLELKG